MILLLCASMASCEAGKLSEHQEHLVLKDAESAVELWFGTGRRECPTVEKLREEHVISDSLALDLERNILVSCRSSGRVVLLRGRSHGAQRVIRLPE